MGKFGEVLNRSLETSRKLKRILVFVAALYVVFLLFGYVAVHMRIPFAVGLGEAVSQGVTDNPVLAPIIGALMTGDLILAIVFTFLVNLTVGAFISTTLPGLIPLLGGIASVIISAFRGFVIGAAYYEVLRVSVGYTVVALGTLILELGAYVFSAAAGINISLSAAFPRRYNVGSRWIAFKEAWKDAGRLYVIVVVLLALGAAWEMFGIYLAMP